MPVLHKNFEPFYLDQYIESLLDAKKKWGPQDK